MIKIRFFCYAEETKQQDQGTKYIVRGSDPNVSHTLSFILCGMLLILDCCLTGIDCLYHIHIKLGFTFIGIQTV